jgi:hypothetical protein
MSLRREAYGEPESFGVNRWHSGEKADPPPPLRVRDDRRSLLAYEDS